MRGERSERLEAAVGLSITAFCAPDPSGGRGPEGFGEGGPHAVQPPLLLCCGVGNALSSPHPSPERSAGVCRAGSCLPLPAQGEEGVD